MYRTTSPFCLFAAATITSSACTPALSGDKATTPDGKETTQGTEATTSGEHTPSRKRPAAAEWSTEKKGPADLKTPAGATVKVPPMLIARQRDGLIQVQDVAMSRAMLRTRSWSWARPSTRR